MSNLKISLQLIAASQYGKNVSELSSHELHCALSNAVMAEISPKWNRSRAAHAAGRRAYYFSAEFLVGRAIYNNLLCTGLLSEASEVLKGLGADIDALEEAEDAALGNGGLGRLAACFLDSAATLHLPLDGYGIRYKYGLFRQRFEDGFQKEYSNDWSRFGDPWSIRRDDETVTVSFGNEQVRAVPYDMPIIGYGGDHISTLRLWQCEPTEPFDYALFNNQEYTSSLQRKNSAENISRVLYPNDSTEEGKLLRLKQQYFFTSASLQDILRSCKKHGYGEPERLADFIAVQLNDTHPVVSVPELIRLLMREGESFEAALATAKNVFCYTNHTVMQEALEKWPLSTLQRVSPEIADIIMKINAEFSEELTALKVSREMLPELTIIQDGTVNMAYLACRCSRCINGVAQLHTEILKHDVLKCWYQLYPEKFQNKTNGITQRRWLCLSNPELSELITELLGTKAWICDLALLRELEKYADDRSVLDRFFEIRRRNKLRLGRYMEKKDGKSLDADMIVDVQIKRIHEYKRQLLNILAILELYFEIKEGFLRDFTPTAFIFGGKSAPGYVRAKAVIKLINEVSRLISEDAQVRDYIKVIFVSDYNVSYAEKIIAAADVSEQLSAAGTEASGTGNMKLMLNGAVTLGTYDGANIEIFREAGEENNYVFGAKAEELEKIKDTYRPKELYASDPRLHRCLDALTDGTLSDGGTGMFRELYTALLEGTDWHKADHYFLLRDFADFLEKKKDVNRAYRDKYAFGRKCWLNMCGAGIFSSDRAVAEYARDIWKISPSGN